MSLVPFSILIDLDAKIELGDGYIENEHVILVENNTSRIHATFINARGYVVNTSKHLPLIHHTQPVFFFYSTSFQKNIQHFITETFFKLHTYERLVSTSPTDILLAIPEFAYNTFVQDMLFTYGIKSDHILILKNNHLHTFSQIYHEPYYFYNWRDNPMLNAVLSTVRNNLNIQPNTSPSKTNLIYLKRDGVPNNAHNNNEGGQGRRIVNQDAFEAMLATFNFKTITVGDKSIHEKHHLLKDAYIIITPYGANLMNLLFTNTPRHLIVVSNDIFRNIGFYETLIKNNSTHTSSPMHIKLFSYPHLPHDLDTPTPHNNDNRPYEVNIEEIQRYIDGILTVTSP